jgi:hypothetical protein
MTEKCKKILLTVKQKPEFIEKCENSELTTKLAKDYGTWIKNYT